MAQDDDELIVCGARATLRTVKGDATVSWALRSVGIDAPLQFELNATVPPDTAARVLLPCANGGCRTPGVGRGVLAGGNEA